MTETLSRLRELASEADAGPWEAQKDGWTVRVEQSDTEKERGWRICMTHNSGPHRVEKEVANAAYIAAANPQAILALLDRLEAADAKITELREWCEYASLELGAKEDRIVAAEQRADAAYERCAALAEAEAAKCKGNEDDIGEKMALSVLADAIRALKDHE